MISEQAEDGGGRDLRPRLSHGRPRDGRAGCAKETPRSRAIRLRASCARPPSPRSSSYWQNLRATLPRLEVLGDEAWSLSLRDAVRIGLDRLRDRPCPVAARRSPARVRADPAEKDSADRLRDGQLVIHPVSADANAQRFKAEVMALVRSIEQQYWSLSQQYVQLWAAEKVVELADEVVKSEEAKRKAGRGTTADVAGGQSAARTVPISTS